MLKVVQINTFPNKATGAIMFSIHKELQKQGHQSYLFWGRGRTAQESSCEFSFYHKCGVLFHGLMSRLFDNTGLYSKKATLEMIHKLEDIEPDIVHLHNIHGYYVNIKILFNWLKKHNITVVWTFHDCWPFTGHCVYFDYINCQKWKTGCHDCPQKSTYPSSFLLDNSKKNWIIKKQLFSYPKTTIVTPSNWLRLLVKESFLGNLCCEVIHNGINIHKFSPNIDIASIPKEKFKVLGVASEWTPRKGLSDFVKLYKLLPADKVQITLVGLAEKQIKSLPNGITAMKRTDNQAQLVKLYQEADLFFNPTYEDNYPTTNLEALACGTPVCTYNTGGSTECINPANGFIVEQGDVNSVKVLIEKHLNERKMGMNIPMDSSIDEKVMSAKYVDLYYKILK